MPKTTSDKRLERILNLLQELITRRGGSLPREDIWTIEGYRGFPVRESQKRMISRDLSFLKSMGYEISRKKDSNGVTYYKISSIQGKLIVPSSLTENETLSMRLGLKMAKHFVPFLEKESRSLLEKITGLYPDSVPQKAEMLGSSVIFGLPVTRINADAFNKLLDAIINRSTIRIQYTPSSGKTEDHVVSPWCVTFKYHDWYAFGQSNKFKNPGIFRISRIRLIGIDPSSEFIPPPIDFPISDPFSYNPFAEAPFHFRLRIIPPFASSAEARVKWFKNQATTRNKDGSIIFEGDTNDPKELSNWILRACDCIEILEPEQLRKKVKERIEVFLKLNNLHQ